MLPECRKKRAAGLTVALIVLLTSVPWIVQAQPQLAFKRIVSNRPTIELYFTVDCNGLPVYFIDKRLFTVKENGITVDAFELWCSDPSGCRAISAVLVFDASGSMSGSGNAGAKAAGNAFVDMMGPMDEAAVIWFSTTVTIAQGMATSQDQLRKAINSLPAAGNTALWDAIYQGVIEVIDNGVNECRFVIAVTDGKDNASSRQPSEIISLAHQHRLPVFTIGLGDAIDSTQLRLVSEQTGGRYYHAPNASELVAVYHDIAMTVFRKDHMISYASTCMDGGMRTVDVTLQNLCGGSDTKTRLYIAPLDSSTLTPLHLGLSGVTARGDTVVTVPLRLQDSLTSQTTFYPATWTVLFDTSCVHFTGISTPPGSLLEGVPITVTRVSKGVIFETKNEKILGPGQAPAMLAELSFMGSDPEGSDTLRCPLKLSDWAFSAGCFLPLLSDGEILILPRNTNVSDPLPRSVLFELFPDPSDGELTLRIPSRPGETVRITVVDMLGREVLQTHGVSASYRYQTILDLAPTFPGTYYLNITSGTSRWVRSLRLY